MGEGVRVSRDWDILTKGTAKVDSLQENCGGALHCQYSGSVQAALVRCGDDGSCEVNSSRFHQRYGVQASEFSQCRECLEMSMAVTWRMLRLKDSAIIGRREERICWRGVIWDWCSERGLLRGRKMAADTEQEVGSV